MAEDGKGSASNRSELIFCNEDQESLICRVDKGVCSLMTGALAPSTQGWTILAGGILKGKGKAEESRAILQVTSCLRII